MTAPNPARVSMPWHEWDRLVNAPLIATSRDTTLPLLTHVLIRRRKDGRLTGQGTDRYRLVTVRASKEVKTSTAFPSLLLPRKFVERINRAARTTARDRREMKVTLVVKAGVIHVTVESAEVEVTLRQRIEQTPDKFPALDKLHADTFTLDPAATEVAFNPHYLADVKRVAEIMHGRRRWIEPVAVKIVGRLTPALFRIGDDCLYLLVPIRFAPATPGPSIDPWDLDLDGVKK